MVQVAQDSSSFTACPKDNTVEVSPAACVPDAALSEHPPGSWLCSCGNVNYAQRLVCNTRKCGLPKPGTQVAPMASTAQVQPAQSFPEAAPVELPPGSWLCSCGNVNH